MIYHTDILFANVLFLVTEVRKYCIIYDITDLFNHTVFFDI